MCPIRLLVALAAVCLAGQFTGPSSMDWKAYAEEMYQQPPKSITDVVDARPEPSVSLSPDSKWMIQIDRPSMPSIAELSRRWLGLAGMRVDPVANSGFQTGYPISVSIRATNDPDSLVEIPLPDGSKLASLSWSHRSNWLVLAVVDQRGTHLLVVDPRQPTTPRLVVQRANTLWMFVEWLPDGQSFFCCQIPTGRGPEPQATQVPQGPNIQESLGNRSPTRTYQDLLTNQHDEQLFEYFSTSQLLQVQADSGQTKSWMQPAMIADVSASPDGQYLLIETIQKPFSRLMTASSFPTKIETLSLTRGTSVEVVSTPLAENIPIEGVPTWKRSIDWRPDQPATLVWAEAMDGGDPRNKAEFRDRLLTQAAPFDQPPVELCRTEHRFMRLAWTESPVGMLCFEYDRDRRWSRAKLYNVANASASPRTIFDRSVRDRYGDPGSPITVPDENGKSRIRLREGKIWLAGAGASAQGDLPFLDQMDLETLEVKRLWRCQPGVYESVQRLEYNEQGLPVTFITSHEALALPPNLRRRSIDGTIQEELTKFADPTPQIRGIKKQLVSYKRADGVPLSATMYLPEDWQPGKTLPLLVWAYPIEFNDASTAGQITTSPSRFTRISGISHLALVLEGYAVMDNATMPIIGDPETMNDTFIEQIVDAAQAAIDQAVSMGVADRHRVAVGGHSYGAFMTANLLAHCRLFRAGVARSGAYNRTLTPFGFQSERRPYWEAREVYQKVSPFTWADQIKDPLLLIHGEKDNNPGTFPVQSERLYQAIKGNGGMVRLVMLPEESHGYRARESVLHTHYETLQWLNRYVRDAVPPMDSSP